MKQGLIEAGCDEAGRGCLAGPVYAAAVVFPQIPSTDSADFNDDWQLITRWLNDSKQLTEKQRYLLRPAIQRVADAWAVGVADAAEIDAVNILNASLLAMHRAVAQLQVCPQHLIIDGNRWRTPAQLPLNRLQTTEQLRDIPATTVVKGDATYMSIAAASVLAKTGRDDCMNALHSQFPQYHWDENKGYPTEAHRRAIRETGVSPYHRQSFNLLGEDPQLSLF